MASLSSSSFSPLRWSTYLSVPLSSPMLSSWSALRLAPPLDGAAGAAGAGAAAGAAAPNCQLGRPCLSISRLMTGSTSVSLATSNRPLSSGITLRSTSSLPSFAMSGLAAPGGLEKDTSCAWNAMLGKTEKETGPLMRRSRPVASFTLVTSSALSVSTGTKKGMARTATTSRRTRMPIPISSFFMACAPLADARPLWLSDLTTNP